MSQLIQKIKREYEEEQLAQKNLYITIVGCIATLGFGAYFYLNRIKELISVIF